MHTHNFNVHKKKFSISAELSNGVTLNQCNMDSYKHDDFLNIHICTCFSFALTERSLLKGFYLISPVYSTPVSRIMSEGK